MAGREDQYRAEIRRLILTQYQQAAAALAGVVSYVTYGNVDAPDLLAESLPEEALFVDGEVAEIDGRRVGFVGGGVGGPGPGNITDEEMSDKLSRLGPVDVLCSHVPPAVRPLYTDVITGRGERRSRRILEYLIDQQPSFHYFGDIHQPQASRWQIGATRCRNVGYFRATGRAVEHL